MLFASMAMMQTLRLTPVTPKRINRVMDVTAYLFLSDCATISAGFPFRGAVDSLGTGNVAVIQMRNVDDALGVDWAALTRVELPTRRVPDLLIPGDVILTTRGRRNFAFALTAVPGPAVCSPHFFVIRVRQPHILMPEFLAWQINQKVAQEHIQQSATGSYILNLTRAAVEAVPISIPPMATQAAAIAIANTAHREVAVLQALIENQRSLIDVVATKILNPERPTV